MEQGAQKGIGPLKLFYIPTCSRCQRAINFLDEHEISYQKIDLHQAPISFADLWAWLDMGGLLKDLLYPYGSVAQEMDLKTRQSHMTDPELFALLNHQGTLMRRPFLIGKDFYAIGFRVKEWKRHLLGEKSKKKLEKKKEKK